jgi:geranylgeranyl diphosphate synthase type I
MDIAVYRDKVADEIKTILGAPSIPLFGLNSMYSYHLGFSDKNGKPSTGSKGKYLRPLFCIAMCGGLGGDIDKVLPAAASLELIHRTSLIFDDMQDKGEMRNGEPTVWKIWGANQAINAGLALSCYARLSTIHSYEVGISPEKTLDILTVLEKAVIELCQGQYLDLCFKERTDVSPADYLNMVEGKTGALFGAACLVGALCTNVNLNYQLKARDFGLTIGKAFQIWDDYLGIFGDPRITGKTANDLEEKKMTFPVILGMSRYSDFMKSYMHPGQDVPWEADTIKIWLENSEIKHETRLMCESLTQEARTQLSGLALAPEWEKQFMDILSGLVIREK